LIRGKKETAVFEIDDIIHIAIQLEENAVAVYRQALERVAHPRLKALLEWMVGEEKRHAEWFAGLRQRLLRTDSNPIGRVINREMLTEMVGGQSFSLKQVDFSALARFDDLIDVLVEFEKDTILLYELLATFIQDPDIHGQLQTVIAEEKRHITQLEAQRPLS
jgi:rubrerythrin